MKMNMQNLNWKTIFVTQIADKIICPKTIKHNCPATVGKLAA